MADAAVPRSGRPAEESGGDLGSFSGEVNGSQFHGLIQSLPERFREAGYRLVRELYGPASGVRAMQTDEEETGHTPWFTALDLEEAWAVAQAVRRTIPMPDHPGGDGPQVADASRLHAILDRSLLNAADATLEKRSHAHRRMIQDVSHDLRSPLNSILFLADALRSERSGPLTPAQSQQMGVLHTAAVTLVRMANDLIDFSRLGAGREQIVVSMVSFSLETVMANVKDLVGPLAAHREAELVTVFEGEGARHGDQHLVARVLLNLVSNALEAVDKGGEVSLVFRDTDAGDLCIEVGDDRAGTDVDALRQLLSISDDRWSGETRGWTRGLGLTISARLVDAAGGRIEVQSRSGRGTVFCVQLPFPRI